jgi:hypothetical protein
MNIAQKQVLVKKFLLKNRKWENIYHSDVVNLMRKLFAYKHIKIGCLSQTDKTSQTTTYIVYIVKQLSKDFFNQPMGRTVCIRLKSENNISYELSNWFNKQYPFWENKSEIKFVELPLFIEEIMFFLKKGEVNDEAIYILYENNNNFNFPDPQAYQKQISDLIKKQQLKEIFGFFQKTD